MIRKILLSTMFVLMASIASMSQFQNVISNVVIPERAYVGEEITITFDYFVVDPGFFRLVFSNNESEATFWEVVVGNEPIGVDDWANLLDAPVGEVIGASITFTIPDGVDPGIRPFKLRLEEAGSLDVNLLDYDGVMEILPKDCFGQIKSYQPSGEGIIGEEIEVSIVYDAVSDCNHDLTFFFVSAGVNGGDVNWDEYILGNSNAPGNHGWVPISGAITAGTDVEYTASVVIPETIEFPSDGLPVGQEWRLGVRAFGIDIISMPININSPKGFVELNSIDAPSTAYLDEDIDIRLNYTNQFSEEQPVTIGLVRWDIANDKPIDDGDGWQTAGFVDDIAYFEPGIDVAKDISFNISPSETIASVNLPVGEEWRIYVKIGDLGDFRKKITINEQVARNQIKILSVIDDNGGDLVSGDSLVIEYEYHAINPAEIEFSVLLFEDDFTISTPSVVVSNILFRIDLPASVSFDEFESGTVKIKLNDLISQDLQYPQNYKVVAKLLDPSLLGGSFLTLTSFNLSDVVTDLFNNKVESASFTAYPNPSANGTVRFSTEISNMIVVDAIGNVVETAESATELNTSSLESGFYLLKSDQGSVRLVVE